MADKQDNFLGGFLLGTILGSALGVVVASKLANSRNQPEDERVELDPEVDNLQIPPKQNVDRARRSLEQKIAQLNAAIDAVSHELSTATGNGQKISVPKSALSTDQNEERSQNLFRNKVD